MRELRVLIVAENASASYGGEAFLPLHYFRILRARRIEAFVLTHERVRNELHAELPTAEHGRLFFLPDQSVQRWLWRTKGHMQLSEFSLGVAITMLSQLTQRKVVRQLVEQQRITVVHQPVPVSPKLPSALHDVGVPIIIGPMNGGMHYPTGFSGWQGPTERKATHYLRQLSELANTLIPGKRRASYLLVANPRTAAALPRCVSHVPTLQLVENGVDLQRFSPRLRAHGHGGAKPGRAVHFAFVGRLVHWKAVHLLLMALQLLDTQVPAELSIFGDGEERGNLEQLSKDLGLQDRVHFYGFVPQARVALRLAEMDALVLPSVYECGGAVVLEAMALGLPVIATAWGGPADYLDAECGILIPPTDPETFTVALCAAMGELIADPKRRRAMGAAGRRRVERDFDWERKLDRIIAIYQQAMASFSYARAQPSGVHEKKHA